jgi:hypothetical protein
MTEFGNTAQPIHTLLIFSPTLNHLDCAGQRGRGTPSAGVGALATSSLVVYTHSLASTWQDPILSDTTYVTLAQWQ